MAPVEDQPSRYLINTEHDVTELALADLLRDFDFLLVDDPAGVSERLEVDVVIGDGLGVLPGRRQLRAEAVGVLLVVLDQLRQVLEELLLVDGQLLAARDDAVVLNLAFEADAQRVVTGKVGRFSHQEKTVCDQKQNQF